MFDDKRVVIVGWIASALLGFLGGAVVFWTPSHMPVAPSGVPAGTGGPIPTPRSAEPTGGALAGSPSAMPFSPAGAALVTSTTSDAPTLGKAPFIRATTSAYSVDTAKSAASVVTINGVTLQGDTVLDVPSNPADERRRHRMSMDVSSIP